MTKQFCNVLCNGISPFLISCKFSDAISIRIELNKCRNIQGIVYVLCSHFNVCKVYFLWRCGSTRAMTSSSLRFLDHTQRRTTFSSTPLYEWSARRRDLYLTTQSIPKRQTSMPPAGFEPTISASMRPHTHDLYRASSGTGACKVGLMNW